MINAAAMISNTYAEIMGRKVYFPTNARAARRTAIHRVVFFGAEVFIFFPPKLRSDRSGSVAQEHGDAHVVFRYGITHEFNLFAFGFSCHYLLGCFQQFRNDGRSHRKGTV